LADASAFGAVDILPGHTALLTHLGIGEMSVRQGMQERLLAPQWGLAEIATIG
jgi:F0F1-type ATP synthase epsilon subunit